MRLPRKGQKRVDILKGANSYVTLADWRRGYDLKKCNTNVL